MEIGTPFIVDTTDNAPQNHNCTENCCTHPCTMGKPETTFNTENTAVPFEFSRSRMWSESFYSPEIGSGHSIASLEKELCEIKQLINDIKCMLKDLFEL